MSNLRLDNHPTLGDSRIRRKKVDGISDNSWPKFFPSDCPFCSAKPANCTVYRLVMTIPPTAADFQPWRSRNPGKTLPFGVTECQACGVSVYDDILDCQRILRRVKGVPQLISSGKIAPTEGMTLNTPSRHGKSHRTWWIPEGIDPSPIFFISEGEISE